jgi:hypothetical protein
VRKSNILNFVAELDADWKEVFRGSNILSWKQGDDKGSVDLFIIGRLARWTLASAQSDYEPSYRVELDVDDDTASALRALCDSGPLGDADGVHYPIVGRTAVLSTKLRSLQRNDTLQVQLTVNDPFPYLYHGSDLDGGETPLRTFPATQLTAASVVAIETNISSYTIPPKGQFLGRTGYSMSLREVYDVTTTDMVSSGLAEPSPVSRKRPGVGLVSPRRNKQAGQPAVFSD